MAENSSEVQSNSPKDYQEVYANNVTYEASAWDLKLIFSALDQSGPTATAPTRAAVTIPWAQAKLMLYFLQAQIWAHEIDYGYVQVPHQVWPPEITIPAVEADASPAAREFLTRLKELRDKFVHSGQ